MDIYIYSNNGITIGGNLDAVDLRAHLDWNNDNIGAMNWQAGATGNFAYNCLIYGGNNGASGDWIIDGDITAGNEIRIGYFNSKKNKIKILLGNEMDKALLEEWLHAVFFANGFREELGKLEEPLIRLMGRAFRQYLSACQLNYLKIQEVKCQKKK